MDYPALPNEAELAGRLSHDDAAFAVLYDFYLPKIYGFICKRVGNRETTEDLVQQTFLKAFASRRGYSPQNGAGFGAWIYRIATNAVIDHYRTASKRQHLELDDSRDLPDERSGPEQHAETALDRTRLEAAIANLPERDQRVITLKYFSEFSNQEIAEVLGCSANHVGVLLFRALKKVQKTYED